MDEHVERAGRAGGAAAVLLTAVGFAAAIVRSETFAWSTSALSDLGTDPPTALLFNATVVLAGAAALPFCAWRFSAGRNRIERAGAAVMALASLALAGVGLFPAGTPLHLPSALGFYLGFTYALLLAGTGAVLAGEGRPGLLTMWAGVAECSVWLGWALLGTPGGLAVPEALGAAVVGAWVLTRSRRPRRAG